MQVQDSVLGKKTFYKDRYDPSLLFPIVRSDKRKEIGIGTKLPFHGEDVWFGYELSWLNAKGKPAITLAVFTFPCESSHLIESKSFKLYLNSFNQTRFESSDDVLQTLIEDLSKACGMGVGVQFIDRLPQNDFKGISLDLLDIEADTYQVDPSLLKCGGDHVQESIHTNLFKSNCLVTGQPDWASLFIHYQGPHIDHECLLRYIVSYRQHLEFHEQCIERIFIDLMRECCCEKLTVFGKFTRRGGLDINPFRSNFEQSLPHFQTARQ
ncbi:NADPH-dependent 7-cyano-7-deazaguanine reductase QueF [Waddlia chondrophila]|uniref:NADPH-dependent 7-cyano-7-deazaguanine reductase QueF n=1 Tax=Waddlia chondrophila TaxID=71667 RepID=UPI00117FF5AC